MIPIAWGERVGKLNSMEYEIVHHVDFYEWTVGVIESVCQAQFFTTYKCWAID